MIASIEVLYVCIRIFLPFDHVEWWKRHLISWPWPLCLFKWNSWRQFIIDITQKIESIHKAHTFYLVILNLPLKNSWLHFMLLTRVLLQYKRDYHKTKRDLNMFTKIRCMQKPVYSLRISVITQRNNAYCDFEM